MEVTNKNISSGDILDDVNWQEEWDTGYEYDLEYREKLSPGEKYKAFIEGPSAMLDKGCVYSLEDVKTILGQQITDVLLYDIKKATALDSSAMILWITDHPEFNKEREKQTLELRKQLPSMEKWQAWTDMPGAALERRTSYEYAEVESRIGPNNALLAILDLERAKDSSSYKPQIEIRNIPQKILTKKGLTVKLTHKRTGPVDLKTNNIDPDSDDGYAFPSIKKDSYADKLGPTWMNNVGELLIAKNEKELFKKDGLYDHAIRQLGSEGANEALQMVDGAFSEEIHSHHKYPKNPKGIISIDDAEDWLRI